jgi:hypothetical protein
MRSTCNLNPNPNSDSDSDSTGIMDRFDVNCVASWSILGGVSMQMAMVHDSQRSVNDLDLLDRYWRAANYLSVGQIYLLDNPLLREPLRPEHIKPRLLGHWELLRG